ncbi:DUF2267 domain-containing protein [Streptomyces luridiscabiei]|uniref:DUF2267 domain-containing protein n=1 Tax=Streptomyces luridiscabiei TaxID=164114 RepID=UPI000A9F8CAD
MPDEEWGAAKMALRREAFLHHVTERGEYKTAEEAERAARVVLALLGANLVGEVRAQLASRLPDEFTLILLNPLQSAEPLPPERFVRATAAWIMGATEKTATWDVSAVLSTVTDAAGEDLLGQILLQLPVGYDLFFGRTPTHLT